MERKETLKISKVISFVQGKNQVRFSSRELSKLYVRESYQHDLGALSPVNMDYAEDVVSNSPLKSGDILINPVQRKAIVVSPQNSDKIIDNNFIKVVFLSNKIDKNYFLFLFNESFDIKSQLERGVQGSQVFRISISQLEDIVVTLPTIKKQKTLGKIYREIEQIKYLKKKKAEQYDNLLRAIIKNN